MTCINSPIHNGFCFDTPLFRVRLLAASDQTLYRQLFGNQQVMRWIGEPLTEVQLTASFAAALQHNNSAVTELAQGSRLFLIIADRPADQAVGLMAVTFSSSYNSADKSTNNSAQYSTSLNAEIGIMLLPIAQHKGLAHTAFADLCKMLLQLPTVHDIICNIAEGNLAAKKLVSGLGFVYCKQGNCYKLQK